MNFSELLLFHGHKCPGLATGYRLSLAAMAALGVTRSDDEELVAIVENDACGVDALQLLTGCTFGKGNLIFRDYGKQAYTLFSRCSGRGVRVVFHGNGIPPDLHADRMARADFILAAPDSDLLTVMPAAEAIPEPARIRNSAVCAACGETVMESKLALIAGRHLCIPCLAVRSNAATGTQNAQQ